MKGKKTYLPLLLAAAMVLSGIADTGAVEAAKKISLAKSSVTVAEGGSKKVAIKNLNAKRVQKLTVKSSKTKVASVKKSGKNAIKVTGRSEGKATVTIRIIQKNVKKATVLTLKVTVGDAAGTGTQASSAPDGSPLPPAATSDPGAAGTTQPSGGSAGGTAAPPEGGTGTTPSQKPSSAPADYGDAGLYNADGTLQKSWGALLAAGDIVVVDDEITDCDSELTGALKIAANVTGIGDNAFEWCSGLTDITIPDSVTSIGGAAFASCSSLTGITIPDSVTSIGDAAFEYCSSLNRIKVSDENAYYDSREDCNAIIRKADNILLVGCKNTVIPNSVTGIGYCAFMGCSSLTGITIPDSVTGIGSYVFVGCSSLTEITIPYSVTSIGYAVFEYCSSLNTIKVSDENAYYDSRGDCNAIIRKVDNTLLAGCKNTVIPDSVTGIEYNAFTGCSSLTEITIPNSVTSIGDYAFASCSSLTEITIPYSVTSIGGYVFGDCSSLNAIKVSDENAYYDSREDCNAIIRKADNTLLAGCQNTVIPNSVTSIGDCAFEGCSSLTEITIPNSVTSIGDLTFNRCYSLTSITIPDSVTDIGYAAFRGVPHIYYSGTAAGSPWGADAIN